MFKKVRLSVKKAQWRQLVRRYWTWILFVSVMMVVSCDHLSDASDDFGTVITDTPGHGESDALQKDLQASEEDSVQIYVYVCGLVKHPGVYALDEGSRQIDAVEAAGGMLSDACADGMNLAALITDGERIYVPSADEVSGDALLQGTESDGLININTATKEELMTLTGIGESKAQRIIEYRESQGGFPNIEALKNVPGIKDGTYDALKDQITVG